jgi:protein PhnA
MSTAGQASHRTAIYFAAFIAFVRHQGFHMSALPPCPKCNSEFTYEDAGVYICPECAHEWSAQAAAPTETVDGVYRDSAGNVLQDGDTVTVIKDLKLKGSAGVIKMGTKVKNIRLVDSDHDIDCKIDGFGAMSLKSEFVKKV